MIKIHYQELNIEKNLESIIKDRMAELTCKTNLSPQLMFRQSYTGIASKLFVGNWTKSGFWISKFRLQVIELRPDIIIRFIFMPGPSSTRLGIRYSLGVSSILQLVFLLSIASVFFVQISRPFIPYGLAALFVLYIYLARTELKKTEKIINEKLLGGI
ncbi:MAG: hypothetical protein IPH20_15395 [Bacteroidales bacterium]|nr:hypothetical protein [Bacteroidales bacterium]